MPTLADKSNTRLSPSRHDNSSTNTTVRQRLNTILKTSTLSQTPIAPDGIGVAVGVAPPPSLLNAGFDAVTAVLVLVVPPLADLPKLSGTPVGGGASFV